MAKRVVKTATKKPSVGIPRKSGEFDRKCHHKGCTAFTVMMRRTGKKQQDIERYCADHWQSDVVVPNRKSYVEKFAKKIAEAKKPKKKAVRRVVKK